MSGVSHRRRWWWLLVCSSTIVAAVTAGTGGAARATPQAPEPIVIGLVSTVIPGAFDGMTSSLAGVRPALQYIRHNGGWGGRGLKIVTCTSDASPASDEACVRKFVAAKVVAEISLLANAATVELPLLTQARIPFFEANDPGTLTSAWQNVLGSSNLSGYAAPARFLCAKGYKRVTWLVTDNGSENQAFQQAAVPIMQKCGIDYTGVAVPGNAPDLAPYIQKAVSGSPQMIMVHVQQAIQRVVDAPTSAGFPSKNVITNGVGLTTDFFSDPNANGLLFVSGYNYYAFPQLTQPSKDAAAFFKYMTAVSGAASLVNASAATSFVTFVTIWRAGRAIGWKKFNSETLYRYLNGPGNGKLQVFMSRPIYNKVPGLPGVKQPYQYVWRLQNGKGLSLGRWAGFWPCGSPKECASTVPPK